MASRLRQALARREQGQALVELSLCASFLVLVLLAVWQVGTIFSNYIDLSEAARAGARAAAISGAPTATGDTASYTTAVSEGTFAAKQTAPNLTGDPVPAKNMAVTFQVIKTDGTVDAGNTTWHAGSRLRAIITYPYALSLFGVAVTSGTLTVTDDMRVHRLAT